MANVLDALAGYNAAAIAPSVEEGEQYKAVIHSGFNSTNPLEWFHYSEKALEDGTMRGSVSLVFQLVVLHGEDWSERGDLTPMRYFAWMGHTAELYEDNESAFEAFASGDMKFQGKPGSFLQSLARAALGKERLEAYAEETGVPGSIPIDELPGSVLGIVGGAPRNGYPSIKTVFTQEDILTGLPEKLDLSLVAWSPRVKDADAEADF